MVANDSQIVVIEVKFYRFTDAQLMGAVADRVIPEEVGQEAYRKGLFVISQTGDVVRILNNMPFVPRVW